MNDSYKTVKTESNDEFTEKRSRFIGYCKPVRTEQEATDFIAEIKKQHWDARHNVYAYHLREGQIKRYSDDGEPSGTAGMPVLDVILKNEVTDVVVVVTRYFGGVLLGTGGLVRAYSHTAKIALDAAGVVTMTMCVECTLSCSYTQYGKLNTVIMNAGGIVDNTDYSDDVRLIFHIPSELLNALNKQLADATAGQLSAEVLGEKFYEMNKVITD